jgi:hypothetical protein
MSRSLCEISKRKDALSVIISCYFYKHELSHAIIIDTLTDWPGVSGIMIISHWLQAFNIEHHGELF